MNAYRLRICIPLTGHRVGTLFIVYWYDAARAFRIVKRERKRKKVASLIHFAKLKAHTL